MGPWTWTLLAVLFYAPVAIGSVAWITYSGDLIGLRLHTLGHAPAEGALLGLATGLGVVAVSRVLAGVGPMRRLTDGLAELLGPLPGAAIVVLAASSSLGEELLFRGVIQEELGPVLGVLLFAAAHLPIDRGLWLWPVFAVAAGALFAALYDHTGAVLAPVVAHFAINLLNLQWLSARASTDCATAPRPGPPPSPPSERPRTGGPTGD